MKMRMLTLMAVTACSLTLAVGGCDKSRDEMRPDLDTIHQGRGLQSRDLREMSAKLAPDLLTVPDVAASPYRTVIVVKNMENDTQNMPGQNFDILVAKLSADLNVAATRDRLLFKEEHAKLANIQAQELGTAGPGFEDAPRTGQPAAPAELTPDYALYGKVYSMGSGRTMYYLIKFSLTRITGPQAGAIVWSGQYEVNTLN